MTAPTAPTVGAAPWLLSHATACAEAVATALDLLDGDEVAVLPETTGRGFTLRVDADPPRAVKALRWSATGGWAMTTDTALRRTPRWRPLAVEADADPLVLCEVLSRGV